jgi:hypothetical protein
LATSPVSTSILAAITSSGVVIVSLSAAGILAIFPIVKV